MKYLIAFYFILFISIITIINVYSTTKAPKKPTGNWKPMKAKLNGTMVKNLGKQGVEYYNTNHTGNNVTFVNVTKGLRRGKKDRGTKRLKLIILVTKTSGNAASQNNKCQKLRVVFNDTASGKTPLRSKLFNKTIEGECIIPENKNLSKKKNV